MFGKALFFIIGILMISIIQNDPDNDRKIADHVLRMHRYRGAGEQDGDRKFLRMNPHILFSFYCFLKCFIIIYQISFTMTFAFIFLYYSKIIFGFDAVCIFKFVPCSLCLIIFIISDVLTAMPFSLSLDLLTTQSLEETEEETDTPIYEKYDHMLHGNRNKKYGHLI